MNGFSSVFLKEMMHLRRDRAALVIALLVPFLQMLMFGYAINFDVRHIPSAVTDLDNSRESRAYLQRLRSSQYLDLVSYTKDPAEAAEMLKSGAARVAITIPPGFAREQLRGGNTDVGVMIDGSDAQIVMRARSALAPPAGQAAKGMPQARVNVLFNPTSRTANFMIPGLIAVVLGLVTIALTSFSIVREKEQGTLEQLMVTPVGRLALMLGKILPYALLAMFELILVVYLGDVVFGVSVHGNPITLAIMGIPFILASLAIGLLISTIAQTQGQALQMTLLMLMPSILLSGYISPRETMPGWLYLVSDVLPTTYFMQVTRGVIVRGAGFAELYPHFLALLGLSAVLIAAATARFRKNVA